MSEPSEELFSREEFELDFAIAVTMFEHAIDERKITYDDARKIVIAERAEDAEWELQRRSR